VRALITGGAGFIGSHLADRLARDDNEVIMLDNMSTGRHENVSHLVDLGAARLVVGDITDRQLVCTITKDVDAIVHLAAIISVPFSMSHPLATNRTNVVGTLRLLESARRNEISRFISVSSCAVYGEAKYMPIDEGHPTNPSSPYAASKLCSEAYCEAFHNSYGLNTTVLRLFNVYGPRQERNPYAGVIVKFQERLRIRCPPIICGDGRQTRDFVHVNDVVEAIVRSLRAGQSKGRTYNIGSGQATSIGRLADLMINISGAKLKPTYCPPRPGDILHSQADIARAKEELGYEPKVSLDRGLRSLLGTSDVTMATNA